MITDILRSPLLASTLECDTMLLSAPRLFGNQLVVKLPVIGPFLVEFGTILGAPNFTGSFEPPCLDITANEDNTGDNISDTAAAPADNSRKNDSTVRLNKDQRSTLVVNGESYSRKSCGSTSLISCSSSGGHARGYLVVGELDCERVCLQEQHSLLGLATSRISLYTIPCACLWRD
jgi:hypothetical protein